MAMDFRQDGQVVSRRNLSHAVADELLRQIREGNLKPNDALPTERELMARFAVGRNTVREAVQSLVTMGVLDVRPGRGARVLNATNAAVVEAVTMSALLAEQTVNDLFDFRALIEGEMASLAAERATESELAVIREAQVTHERVAKQGLSVHDVDLAFHRAIAHASRNVIYTGVHDALCDLLTRTRPATDTVLGAEDSASEHRKIISAISRRDPAQSREAMRAHFRASLRRLEKARRLGLIPREDRTPAPAS